MIASSAAELLSVLVVEDDPDHRRLIRRRLAERGHHVEEAATGADALASLDQRPVDLVLLDYRLPDANGLDLLQRMLRRGGPAVVLVTAMGSESVAVEALRAGATDYLAKDRRYLDELPGVVMRAWRQHDHARRATELQRLALLVQSATERDDVLTEIVEGSRKLLRARGCTLFVAGDGERAPVATATAGEQPGGVSAPDEVRALLTSAGPAPTVGRAGQLLVPLPSPHRRAVGVLEVVRGGTMAPEDVALAEAFASFAGLAIANSDRLELERSLVNELQQVIDTRRELLAGVSHELRTPLTCIRGFSRTLAERGETLAPQERRAFADLIAEHATDLHHLVEQLLEVANVQSSRPEAALTDIDLAGEIGCAVEALRPLLGERTVDVDVPGCTVLADSVLLRRVIANLLSNAAKYSPAEAPIIVRGRLEDGRVALDVVDRGHGLEPDEVARVFEPFWRSRSAMRSAARGTGVGLSLVQAYVRAMDGSVSVRSTPGEGSTFTFTLPLAGARAGSGA